MKLATILHGPVRTAPALLATIGLSAAIAGCGSSSSSSSSSSPPPTSSSSAASSGGYGAPASTTASSPATQPHAVAEIATKRSPKLGTILAGTKSLTLYLFEADRGSKSTCSGDCAKVWPPVLTTGKPAAGTGAQRTLLGTTTRSDGTTQVTYKGHPLYYYAKDGDGGDAYGQGIKSFGANWYVLGPSGTKVDHS